MQVVASHHRTEHSRESAKRDSHKTRFMAGSEFDCVCILLIHYSGKKKMNSPQKNNNNETEEEHADEQSNHKLERRERET